MAQIYVDTDAITSVVKVIDAYIAFYKSCNKRLLQLTSDLGWKGDDYAKFKNKFDTTVEMGTNAELLATLTLYSDHLRNCAKNYEAAQTTASNKASRL